MFSPPYSVLYQDDPHVLWYRSHDLVDYPDAVHFMETYIERMDDQTKGMIWLLEHPPLYTMGTSAVEGHLRDPVFPVYSSSRGGESTYHGPGQRVVYTLLDLNVWGGKDIRSFVHSLQRWVSCALKIYNVASYSPSDRVGVWIKQREDYDEKIAAIGVRVRRWKTFHGVCVNICPDLSHYAHIVPCGQTHHGVTSLHKEIGVDDLLGFDAALYRTFYDIFSYDGA